MLFFPVLAAAVFADPLDERLADERVGERSSGSVGSCMELLDAARDAGLPLLEHQMMSDRPPPREHRGVDALLADWLGRFGVECSDDRPRVVPHELWASVAELMVRGQVSFDCTPIANRMPRHRSLRLLDGHPSRAKLLEHMGRSRSALVPVSGSHIDPRHFDQPTQRRAQGKRPRGARDGRGEEVVLSTRSGVHAYSTPHLISAVRASITLKSLDALRNNIDSILELLAPHDLDVAKGLLQKNAFESPSRWTLSRARIKLDCAAMLAARREHRRPRRSVWRCWTFDASPKKGYELFAANQYVVYDGNASVFLGSTCLFRPLGTDLHLLPIRATR